MYCSARWGVSFWSRYEWVGGVDGKGLSYLWYQCELNTVNTQVYIRRGANEII